MHTMTILIATDLENSNKTAFPSQILPDIKDKKNILVNQKSALLLAWAPLENEN